MRDICLRLLRADSEAEVEALIKSEPSMNNPENWRPLDRRETNFNITSNQASDGGKALTELMTNMVDAVLMRRANEENIKPKDFDAPKDMYEAVDRLIKDLRGGKLASLDKGDNWLREFSRENLIIGVSGAKKRDDGLPCYTFVDSGEGQESEKFEETFLSLSAGNKKDIRFVQGKYNMGSSGVLGFCGEKWFKLIISRRYDGKSPWGWTIMRRRPDDTGEEMPIAEYFVPNGEIPKFDSQAIHPFCTQDKQTYPDIRFETGTIVKLYNYHVGVGTIDFKSTSRALYQNLMETILPFRIFDFRSTPVRGRGIEREKGIDARPFYGMEFLLLRGHKEEGLKMDEAAAASEEDKISVGRIEGEFGKISVTAIPLKPRQESWLRDFCSNNRIFHTVNGQVQYKETRGYLSQQCKFPALKDRVIIIVNASDLTFKAHNDIWKGDREHIRQTQMGESYKEEVKKIITESVALKELSDRIASQELERTSNAEHNELVRMMVREDPTLFDMLLGREPNINIADPENKSGEGSGKNAWDGGLYSPTFIHHEGKTTNFQISIHQPRPISFKTDAENGYLIRDDNCGRILLPDEIRQNFDVKDQLNKGRLILYFHPRELMLNIGRVLSFSVGLKDNSMPEAVKTEELTIEITDAIPEKKQKSPPEKERQFGQHFQIEPPHIVLLTKNGRMVEGMEDYEFQEWGDDIDEHEGGFVKDLGENRRIFNINYHNVHLQKKLKIARGSAAKKAVIKKYIIGMWLVMLSFENVLKNKKVQWNDETGLEDSVDELRLMLGRTAAASVLKLSESLPKIVDTSSIKDDEIE